MGFARNPDITQVHNGLNFTQQTTSETNKINTENIIMKKGRFVILINTSFNKNKTNLGTN